MKVLWTLLKVAVVLVIGIPLAIFLFGTALTVLAAMLGIAVAVLRIAIVGLLIYGGFKLFQMLFGRSRPKAEQPVIRELPKPDPYYEAAMRDLDREMGDARR